MAAYCAPAQPTSADQARRAKTTILWRCEAHLSAPDLTRISIGLGARREQLEWSRVAVIATCQTCGHKADVNVDAAPAPGEHLLAVLGRNTYCPPFCPLTRLKQRLHYALTLAVNYNLTYKLNQIFEN